MDKDQRHSEDISSHKLELKKVKESYEQVHSVYENKFRQTEKTFKEHVDAINKRVEYEKAVITENKDREKTELKSTYETTIFKYERDFNAKVEEEKMLVVIQKDELF